MDKLITDQALNLYRHCPRHRNESKNREKAVCTGRKPITKPISCKLTILHLSRNFLEQPSMLLQFNREIFRE